MRAIILSTFLAIAALAGSGAAAQSAEIGIEEKIGQMIMVGFLGDNITDPWFEKVLGQIGSGRVGGVLYLKRNVAGKRSVQAMNEAIAQAAGGRAPPLIGIDQEGGRIQRLTPRVGFPSTPSASRVAGLDPRAAYETYAELGRRLHEWGFNLNLGPVVDLNVNPRNPVIGRLGRSFSSDPEIVRQYAAAFIKGHREAGMLTAIKHFPGHGSSTADSHDSLVDVSNTWSKAELAPFGELVHDGTVDMVMTAHVHNSKLQAEGDTDPVSLSRRAIHDVLRGELGFQGVVISDDMQMAGVQQLHDLRGRVLRAVLAGTDILIFANDKNPDIEIPDKVISILATEAATREDVASRIDESYGRIIRLKRELAIRAPRTANPAQLTDPQTTRAIPQATPIARTVSKETDDADGRVTIVTPQVMAAMTRDTRLAVAAAEAVSRESEMPAGL